MVTCAFFGGFVVKKVMAAMSSLSFMVMVAGGFVFFWCLWFSSLELTTNNEMMVLFYVDGCNG